MSQKANFYWLDLLRGLAAVLVFLSHIRVLYFIDFSGKDQPISSTIFYFITGFGHSSVIIFFVLSGFFIIRSIGRAVDSGSWSTYSYVVDRLSRLWVALIPALLFTFFIDWLGTTYFPDSPAYLGEISSLRDVNPSDSTSWSVFWGNVFFLQTIRFPTFGSNSSLWSLTYEFWYYLIFPIMYFAVVSKEKYIVRIGYVLLSALLLFFAGRKIALYFIVWLMGGAIYFLQKNRHGEMLQRVTILFISLTLLFVTLAGIRLGLYPTLFNNYSLGITTSFAALTLIQYDMKSALMRKVATFLSNISYTLYLVHLPLSVFLTSMFIQQRQEFNLPNLLSFIILCAGVMTFSYGFWVLFEKQTPRVRDWAKSKLMMVYTRILWLVCLIEHFPCEIW